MGGCFSDMKGAKAAVGGGVLPQTAPNNNNDAVDFFYTAQGFQPLFTQVELSLSACKLLDLDITSKSDPMAVLYAKKGDGRLEELGRTEVIMNSLNPEWIEKISIAFHFEMVQPLVYAIPDLYFIFHVYDIDTTYHGVPTKIVTKPSRSLTLKLQNKRGNSGQRNQGAITIHAEESVAAKSAVEIIFRCSHLDNKDNFSKSDPFLRISRIVESGGSVPICKTEVKDNNLNPKWNPVCLNFQQFGSKDNPLVIECFDFNSSGNHVLIGCKIVTSKFVANSKLQKSVADLEKLYHERTGANFVMPSRRHGQEKVLKGQLFVDQYCEKEQFSFIDYISSGFELNFMVAVDFTASNRSPQQPDSLHYIDISGRLNSYQKDGVVTDLQETINALVKASDLPLSILIVGVGSADFTSMEVLDADNGRRLESSTGRIATRDIVQFVPMREVQSGQISVVQALLEELPNQFLTFMRSRDIKPLASHFPCA
ncbi:hypothetical protein TSUD_345650 [Trifolium subterraneum]|nr:hypothetical protein TSUD_345650 [Trifolium subterraneum]